VVIGNMNPTIAANIQAFRKEMRLTQEQLAAYLECKREMISYYENAERAVPISVLERLADVFGVETAVLLEEHANHSAARLHAAFRGSELTDADLRQIAAFKRVIKNYIRMDRIHETLSH
jgi:transcriptional regulator with XRE-family HTH domain